MAKKTTASKKNETPPAPKNDAPAGARPVLAYLNRDHPSGTFRKLGRVFLIEPTVVYLTAKEIEELKQFETVLHLRFDPSAISRFEKTKPNKGNAEKGGAKGGEKKTGGLKDLSIDVIISKLEESGLKSGTDFDPEADKSDLIALLKA